MHQNYPTRRTSVEYTNKAAETNKVPHPLLTKKKQLHEQMKALAVEFGLHQVQERKLSFQIVNTTETNVEKEFDV